MKQIVSLLVISLLSILVGCHMENTVQKDESLPNDDISSTNMEGERQMEQNNNQSHPYVGMWVTEDGHIRHELLKNGRYDEARGDRQSAYQGSYTITDDYIEYLDDTGFTADGEFVDGVLYHAGMVLYREE